MAAGISGYASHFLFSPRSWETGRGDFKGWGTRRIRDQRPSA